MKRWTILALLALLAVAGTAGSKVKNWDDDHMRVDGVKLEHKRMVEIEGDADGRLELESALGDMEIRGVPGNTVRLRVEIHEAEPGDISVELSHGRLRLTSASDNPGAIGDVWAEVPADLDLELSTGYGDMDVSSMNGSRRIILETGLGTITAEDLEGVEELEMSTGKGDLRLGPVKSMQMADLSTGMGGIKVRDAQVEELEVGSGMGGIDFLDCDLGLVSGGTGMGKVRFKRTEYRRSDVSSGWGGVHGD